LFDNIYVANQEFIEGRQFIEMNLSDYISQEEGTKIGAYLSSVKELAGWEL
jgi:hypothetical protein